MILRRVYNGTKYVYRAYKNGQIVWDFSTYTSGVASAAMLGFAMAQLKTPLDTQLCASANALLSALVETVSLEDLELKAAGSGNAEAYPEAKTPEAVQLRAGAVMQGFACGFTYGMVYTSGAAFGKMTGTAFPHTADAVPAMGTVEAEMTGFASPGPVEMLNRFLLATGAGSGEASAETQAPLAKQLVASGTMAGIGYATTLPVHTVTFMNNGEILHQEKVIDGRACPDPVATGKIAVPTKEATVSHTFEYSGWEAESAGTMEETLILEEQQFSTVYLSGLGVYGMDVPADIELVPGETYIIRLDNTDYSCICQDTSALMTETTAVGNLAAFDSSLPGNNEPFIVLDYQGGSEITVLCVTDTAPTEHTIAIYQVAEAVAASATDDPLSCITRDTVFNATFTESIRYYTVRFYDNGELVDSVSVPYGGTAETDYMKDGFNQVEWVPSNENISGDTDCHGLFSNITFDEATWAQIVNIANSGKAASSFAIGDKKEAVLTYEDGSTESVNFVLAGFDQCNIYDGTSSPKPCNMVLVTENALATKQKMHNAMNAYWNGSNLDTYLSNTVYNALPAELRNGVKQKDADATALMGNQIGAGTPRYCWLLDIRELNITDKYTSYTGGAAKPLPIFTNDASRVKRLGNTGVATDYWTLSDYMATTYVKTCVIGTDGSVTADYMNSTTRGVVFGIIL